MFVFINFHLFTWIKNKFTFYEKYLSRFFIIKKKYLNKKRDENYLDNGEYISVIWISNLNAQPNKGQIGRELNWWNI